MAILEPIIADEEESVARSTPTIPPLAMRSLVYAHWLERGQAATGVEEEAAAARPTGADIEQGGGTCW